MVLDPLAPYPDAPTTLHGRASTGWIPLLWGLARSTVAGVGPVRALRTIATPCDVCSLGSSGPWDPVVPGWHHCRLRTEALLAATPDRAQTFTAAGWAPTPLDTALGRVREHPPERIGLVVDGRTSNECLRVARAIADAGVRVAVEGIGRDRAALLALRRATGLAAGTVGFDALLAAELVVVWGPITTAPMAGRWLRAASRLGVTVVAVQGGPRPWWAEHVLACADTEGVAQAVVGVLRHRGDLDRAFVRDHTSGDPGDDRPPVFPPGVHPSEVEWLAGRIGAGRRIVSVGAGWTEALADRILTLHLLRGALGARGAGVLPLPVAPNGLGAAAAGLLDHTAEDLAADPPALLLRIPAGPTAHPEGSCTTSADRRVRLRAPDPAAPHDAFADWRALAGAVGAEVPWTRPSAARDPTLQRPGDQVQPGGPWLHDGGRFATHDARAVFPEPR